MLDIILVTKKNHVTTSGVGDPFLIKSYVIIVLVLDALDTTNTEHRSLTRFLSTSQFPLICYFMELAHFNMKPMSAYFKWYTSTYQILRTLFIYQFSLLLA